MTTTTKTYQTIYTAIIYHDHGVEVIAAMRPDLLEEQVAGWTGQAITNAAYAGPLRDAVQQLLDAGEYGAANRMYFKHTLEDESVDYDDTQLRLS